MTRQNHKRGFNLSSSSSNAVGQPCKGFSLIEAAFVLAVVGGVIGAIWVAAAKFYEDYKVNKTVSDLQLIVKGTQNLISYRDSESVGPLSQTLIAADIIPKDWVQSDGIHIKTLYGTPVSVNNEIGTPPEPNRFYIELANKLTTGFCVKFIMRLSATADMQGNDGSMWGSARMIHNIRIIKQDDSKIDLTVLPISLGTAETSCNNVKEIIIYYPYTRNN